MEINDVILIIVRNLIKHEQDLNLEVNHVNDNIEIVDVVSVENVEIVIIENVIHDEQVDDLA